jgi:hypothetical protein
VLESIIEKITTYLNYASSEEDLPSMMNNFELENNNHSNSDDMEADGKMKSRESDLKKLMIYAEHLDNVMNIFHTIIHTYIYI